MNANSASPIRKSLRKAGAESWKEARNDLLTRCSIVTSAPAVFFWSGEHAVLDGAVAVVQQVPLRVYVGLEPLELLRGDDPRLILLDEAGAPAARGIPPHVYRREDAARPCDFAAPERETNLRKVADVANFLFRDLCRIAGARPPNRRYRIRTFSELRPGGGINWSGAFAVALVTAMLSLANTRFRKDIRSLEEGGVVHWGQKRLSDLVREPQSWFTRINRWAWILEAAFHEGAGSGYGNLASLAPSILPIAYRRAVSKRMGGQYLRSVLKENEEFDAIPVETLYGLLKEALGPEADDPIPYAAYTFRAGGFGPKAQEADVEWPLVYGVIDTWWPKSTGKMIRKATTEQDEVLVTSLGQLEDTAFNPFGDCAGDNPGCFGLGACPRGGSTMMPRPALSSHCTHLTLAAQSAVVCQRVRAVLETRSSDAAQALVAAMAQVHGGLEHLGLAWPGADTVRGELARQASALGIRAAAKLSGAGGGGCLLFAMTARPAADTIQKMEKRLAACLYKLPDSRELVSPTLLWHSGELLSGQRPVPGLCVEVMTADSEAWGRSHHDVPVGRTFFFPPGGGRRASSVHLTQIPQDQYVVVARLGGDWLLLPESRLTSPGARPTFVTKALEILVNFLQNLSLQSKNRVAKKQITLTKGEILKLFLGYKGNIASMGKTISALLKDAMTFDAHGSKKNPRLTITRHGPLGMAFWTPAA